MHAIVSSGGVLGVLRAMGQMKSLPCRSLRRDATRSLLAPKRVWRHAPSASRMVACMPCAQGYDAYVAILYTLLAILLVVVILCLWIAHSYKNRSFAYQW